MIVKLRFRLTDHMSDSCSSRLVLMDDRDDIFETVKTADELSQYAWARWWLPWKQSAISTRPGISVCVSKAEFLFLYSFSFYWNWAVMFGLSGCRNSLAVSHRASFFAASRNSWNFIVGGSAMVVTRPFPWLFSSTLIQDSSSRSIASSIVIFCCLFVNARRLWDVPARDAGIIVRSYVHWPSAGFMLTFLGCPYRYWSQLLRVLLLHFSSVIIVLPVSRSETAHRISAFLDLGALLPLECQRLFWWSVFAAAVSSVEHSIES